MGHRKAVSLQIRRMVADVYGRSVHGTREDTAFNAMLPGRFELQNRIAMEIGVTIAAERWVQFLTVGDIINFVHRQIELEYANASA